jgi:hypothetical protein
MKTQDLSMGFKDYSSLAHATARFLPEDSAIKGSQLLAAMAKSKGFKSTQAFKASFSTRVNDVPTVLIRDSDLSISYELRTHFIKVLREALFTEFRKDKSLLLITIHNWIYISETKTTLGGKIPGLFEFAQRDYESTFERHCYYGGEDNPLEGISPAYLNEAFRIYGKGVTEAHSLFDLYSRDHAFTPVYSFILKESWKCAFRDVAIEFFSHFQCLLSEYIRSNFHIPDSGGLDLAKLHHSNDLLSIKNMGGLINDSLNSVSLNSQFVPNDYTREGKIKAFMARATAVEIKCKLKDLFTSGDDMLMGRLSALLSCVLPYVVYKRDHYDLTLSFETLHKHFDLDVMYLMSDFDDYPESYGRSLKMYMHNLPAFNDEEARLGCISERSYTQHNEVYMIAYDVLAKFFEEN